MIRQTKWRFLDSGTMTPQWNMAIDEALLNGFHAGDMPILRLYGWENTLSLGRFSILSKSLHQKNIQSNGVPCVRRMSGGGILVHGGDLSYTLIIPRDWVRTAGVKESYRYVCGFLIRLYKNLGHTARFACDLHLNETASDICLAGCESYDLMIEGKKMGGNAQRHTGHAVFHHGSIPRRIDVPFFKPLFTEDGGLEKAATLENLGIFVSYEELSALVREAFSQTFQAQLVPDSLRFSERQRAQELYMQKYTQERWNIHAQCANTQTVHP